MAADQDVGVDKWKIRIRLYSNSHSIRPKILNDWNKKGAWIKLFPVDNKKNQMILEITMKKSVTVHSLYHTGWAIARGFVTALNIGSLGVIWWHVPEQISRYYEKMIDLENNSELRLERTPALRFDWENRVLTETELFHAAICFAMMPKDNEGILSQSLGSYIGGVSFLCKVDIHLSLEPNAYHHFYEALKGAMRAFGDWDEVAPFSEAFRTWFGGFLQLPEEDLEYYLEFFKGFDQIPACPTKMNLEDVGKIKVLCDAYYLKNFKDKFKEQQEKKVQDARVRPR